MIKLAEYRGRLAEIPLDFHELLGALAPRPVFIKAPLGDSNFRERSVDEVVTAASAMYRLYGAEKICTSSILSGGAIFGTRCVSRRIGCWRRNCAESSRRTGRIGGERAARVVRAADDERAFAGNAGDFELVLSRGAELT